MPGSCVDQGVRVQNRGPVVAEAGVPADALVVLPVAGDRRARDVEFAEFMAANEQTLLRAAWLLCGDAHRAEDLTQQALVRTYVAWPRARRIDPLAYARRVLVNLRTDTWRRTRREHLVAPDAVPDRPTHQGDRVEDRDRLVSALAVLSARQRRVVVLRYLLDLSEAEVATDLGISVGTVKSTASRALARLRDVMTESPTQGGDR